MCAKSVQKSVQKTHKTCLTYVKVYMKPCVQKSDTNLHQKSDQKQPTIFFDMFLHSEIDTEFWPFFDMFLTIFWHIFRYTNRDVKFIPKKVIFYDKNDPQVIKWPR